jgi:hypothetical protein
MKDENSPTLLPRRRWLRPSGWFNTSPTLASTCWHCMRSVSLSLSISLSLYVQRVCQICVTPTASQRYWSRGSHTFIDYAPLKCFMNFVPLCRFHSTVILHPHISLEGWIVCPLIPAVQRRRLTLSTWPSSKVPPAGRGIGRLEFAKENLLTLWSRSSSKCYLRIQSVYQREHHTSPLQRSTG